MYYQLLIGSLAAIAVMGTMQKLIFTTTNNAWLLLAIAVLVGFISAIPIGTVWMRKVKTEYYGPEGLKARRFGIYINCIVSSVCIVFWLNYLVPISKSQLIQAEVVLLSGGSRNPTTTFESCELGRKFKIRLPSNSEHYMGDRYNLEVSKGLFGFDVVLSANKLVKYARERNPRWTR